MRQYISALECSAASGVLCELLFKLLKCFIVVFLIVKVNDKVPPFEYIIPQRLQVQTHPFPTASQDEASDAARVYNLLWPLFGILSPVKHDILNAARQVIPQHNELDGLEGGCLNHHPG